MPDVREPLGRLVHETWSAWWREIQEPPASEWKLPWERVNPGTQELDMRIGHAVANHALAQDTATCDPAGELKRLMAIVRDVDAHLDANTAEPYRQQPLGADWARITKVCEEAGEVWKALSKATGENPRKGLCGTWDDVLEELGDTASAALCAIQHITKDEARTAAVLVAALEKAHRRVGEFAQEDSHA